MAGRLTPAALGAAPVARPLEVLGGELLTRHHA
jgi:hypothetical protein